jgi:hypothetical protein
MSRLPQMRSAAAKKIKRESRDNTDIDKSIMFGSGCYVQFHKHYYPKFNRRGTRSGHSRDVGLWHKTDMSLLSPRVGC